MKIAIGVVVGLAACVGIACADETLYDLAFQLGYEDGPAEQQSNASDGVSLEDLQWWGKNKPEAIDRRMKYNECVLKHIGGGASNGAVSQVRYSCRQLHWPHEWPGRYLTQTVPN